MAPSLQLPGAHGVFLATVPASRGQRRLAVTAVLVSTAAFVSLAPFAQAPLGPVWTFIPLYQSALVISDVITAVLLFGQFSILRSRALWVLASGYLFTAFMTIAHTLSFPGLFTPTGLLGAGPQTTAWLYMFWHGGFPLVVVLYAVLSRARHATSPLRGPADLAILASVALVLVFAGGITLLATAGQNLLPAIMHGHHYTATMIVVVGSVWGLSLLALVTLWLRRPHSVVDLWLMVVMCAWLFDIALAAVLNAGRFDLGFYAGRLYGLLAATFVLAVLLLENGRLYARLVAAHAGERQERRRAQQAEEALERYNRSLEQTVAERTQRLLQSEKLATMGSLLAGVAHELNNPLAVLMGHAQLLRLKTTDEGASARAEKMHTAAERCVRIVRNFLALARQRAPERGDVALNQVIREALEMLGYELRTDNVEVAVDLADEVPILWADGHQLHQVVVNLVTNAHHALRRMAGTRKITITTRLDRQRVQLTIADTGPGIPPAIREKVFEPFFTTKAAGEGTGLGLSLCRGIIEDHGGTIAIDSGLGPGARFVIELPVTDHATAAAGTDRVESLPPVGPKRILVIDDEPEIGEILTDILAASGHHVDVVHDGAAALTQMARRTYDLVLSDTRMPILDGVAFYRELERRSPALCRRLVFLTGDVLDREKREFFESIEAPVLTKPFEVSEVRRVVHRMLIGGERVGPFVMR